MSIHKKSLVKLMQENSRSHHLWDVFRDFVEMAACSISNAIDPVHREQREQQYMNCIRKYEPDEQARFPQMMAELVMALEAGPDDIMGALFGELDQGNAARGQFFTSYEVCKLMARIQVQGGDLEETIRRQGFVTVMEPACGAGAMCIAVAEAIQEAGFNYQQHMHVTAIDVDQRAAHMAYIQLSLLHIPAVVIVGNTLTLEEREHWCTPAHIMGMWDRKLRRGYALGSEAESHGDQVIQHGIGEHVAAAPILMQPVGQLELFGRAA